jgi:hypothetical protein
MPAVVDFEVCWKEGGRVLMWISVYLLLHLSASVKTDADNPHLSSLLMSRTL